MRVASRKRNERRRGLILLVILAMLTIMAIVGITFLYVADNRRVQARYFKEADVDRFRGGGGGGNTGGSQPADIDPNELLKWAYGQLIYDVADDASGVRSSMRGHSLARSMYGLNDYTLNMVPFNGTGRLHYQMSLQNLNTDHHRLINYMYFRPYRTGQTPPSTGSFLHDPERMHARTSTASPRGPFTGGHNVDYTYPDLNNMFLAAIQADGTILTPSFHRESNAGSLERALDQSVGQVSHIETSADRPRWLSLSIGAIWRRDQSAWKSGL